MTVTRIFSLAIANKGFKARRQLFSLTGAVFWEFFILNRVRVQTLSRSPIAEYLLSTLTPHPLGMITELLLTLISHHFFGIQIARQSC